MATIINGDGIVTAEGTSTTQGRLRLGEDTDNGTNYVELQAPANVASNVTFTLPAADGTSGQVLQTNASGALSFGNVAVANGGTGATSLTANNVILGNGTSAVQFVAPGTAGNLLTSNGTTWQSVAPSASGALTNNVRQAVTSSSTTTINLNSGNVVDLTMAASISTLSFTNVPTSGTPILVQIIVRNNSTGTAYTITWPNSIYWNSSNVGGSQTAPTLASGQNGVTVIALLTTDGGTKWRGWVEASIPGGVVAGLYSFGANQNGECGLNTVNIGGGGVSSPTQVGSLTTWAVISAGWLHSLAIRTDGTLWAWGRGTDGNLGQNDTISRSSPVQIGTGTNWATCAGGNGFSMFISTSGQLWAVGSNSFGIFGNNNQNSASSPVQVGNLTNWSKISTSQVHWLAIKTDGTLWGCGSNQNGRLGIDSAVTARSSPVQIGALTTWASCSAGYSHSGAVKNDSTLWMWGNNQQGAIGDNTTITASSPVQIGGAEWLQVTTAGKPGIQFTGAIKTNGTMWSWGNGAQGRLGNNSTIYRSSPTQIGALTTWAEVSAGGGTMGAVRGDNTLWTWGYSGSGRTGRTYSNDSSPVQVTSLTWSTTNGISMNGWGSLARAGTLVNPG